VALHGYSSTQHSYTFLANTFADFTDIKYLLFSGESHACMSYGHFSAVSLGILKNADVNCMIVLTYSSHIFPSCSWSAAQKAHLCQEKT